MLRRFCEVAFITLEVFQIIVSTGSFGTLVASSASATEVEIDILAGVIAVIDFSVF